MAVPGRRSSIQSEAETVEPGGSVARVQLLHWQSAALEVMLEPWGDHIFIPSGQSYEVVERSSEGNAPTVEWSPDHVTVWSNNQVSDLEVRRSDGTLVWSNGASAELVFERLQSKKIRDVLSAIQEAGDRGVGQDEAISKLARKGASPMNDLLALVEHGLVAVDELGRVLVRDTSTAA